MPFHGFYCLLAVVKLCVIRIVNNAIKVNFLKNVYYANRNSRNCDYQNLLFMDICIETEIHLIQMKLVFCERKAYGESEMFDGVNLLYLEI